MRVHRWWLTAPPSGTGRDGERARPPDEDELASSEAAARALAARWTPRLLAFMAVAAVVFWPLDLLGPDALIPVLSDLRINCLVAVLGLLAVATFTPVTALAPRLFMAASVLIGVFVLAWSVAAAGGLSEPWFHFLTTISALTAFVPIALGPRVAFALATGATLSAGYFLRFPEYLDHPTLPYALGQTTFAALLSIVLGHLLYSRLRHGHVQQRRLAAQSERLAALSASLEAQVAAQTQELRRLTHHLDRSVDHERRALASEIHDELGQELTALGFALAAARQRLHEAPRKLRAAVKDADHLLTRTRETVRRIVARLEPRVLEQLGLCGAARWALEDLAKRAGLETHFACGEAAALETLPADTIRALFRALVEGLNNVARHAQAHRVTVVVDAVGGQARLSVTDDGRGLDGRAPEAAEGLGLLALRERTRAMGGEARWGNLPGGGFELTVRLPIGEPPAAAPPEPGTATTQEVAA